MGNPKNIEAFQFQPGNPGGGRPKGSRAKLSELAASLLYANFAKNGADTIERVRLKRPEVYLASVIALLPKQAQKVESPFADISDAELEALEQHLAVVRAKLVKDIEHEPQNTEPSRGRVANTATDDHGKTIQNADPVVSHDPTINLDAERLDGMDASVDDRNARTVDGVDDAA